VKGVGENAVTSIVRERKNRGPFRDIFDFCDRIDTQEVNKRVVEGLIRVGAFDLLPGNRPQLLCVYEQVLDANANRRKQNVAGQLSLFDLGGDEGGLPVLEEARTLPPMKDYPLRQRLAAEREMSGVYITGHPLDDYREQLKQFSFTTLDLQNLDEREDQGMGLDGRNVLMAGILTEVKGKATKKGAYMGFITLEDLNGQIECLVFPKVFERYRGVLAVDDLVVLEGKLSIREEEAPKLLVDIITPLEEWKPAQARSFVPRRPAQPQLTDAQLAAKAPRRLYLRLSRDRMVEASSALALHPGSVPVYLHIPEEKLTLLCPRVSWCDASSMCMDRLSAKLGAENVKLVDAPTAKP